MAEGFQPLDLFGPLDTFEGVNNAIKQTYQCDIASFSKGQVKSASRHIVVADYGLTDIQQLDYLIICGGSGMRQLALTNTSLSLLTALANKAEKVISICTGAFVMAQLFSQHNIQNCYQKDSGERLRLTTHWRHCHELADKFPQIQVLSSPLFVQDGKIWSSAGVLSGVDLALEIVRQDLGNTAAASVAKELVVYLQRKGSQKQFSDLLKNQSADSLRLAPVTEWLLENLGKNINTSDIANQLCVSERQSSRLFKQHLKQTPAQYLNQLRMHQARDLLSDDNRSLQQVSRSVGFSNYESFRRSFQRYFGLSPSAYQP
ncbi:helix-turn-helix domain-containing protein [Paraglaciecola aquimarina]|uniref:Helix-turn-helix domain-containing protein n=1 Tax=Paraglaciecola aquimarina TaxID=1235557 RepID=A0ABU3SX77_9ALTE|nr:helix-turn-helix domain-containing protein [Paraglaciecola aquimarina]MDU0354616.1 helix-turn-helix domain-containing protein [Paraglaciecola aquimarina]